MTRLLVSVRSVVEFNTASEAGVDVIDIKEPDHGSLGRATMTTIHEIVAHAAENQHVSVALGELGETADDEIELPERIDYAKFGLAGCLGISDWRARWEARLKQLPPDTTRVAVAYADWSTAHAPRIEDVLSTGVQLGCGVLLIDTFGKEAGNLLAHLSLSEIVRFVDMTREAGLRIALAGSLDATAIDRLRHLAPDLIAVRSAACRGVRTSSIDRQAIIELKDLLPPKRAVLACSRRAKATTAGGVYPPGN